MLNEVKHLVLRTGEYYSPWTRFFGTSCLRMTLARDLSLRAERSNLIPSCTQITTPLLLSKWQV